MYIFELAYKIVQKLSQRGKKEEEKPSEEEKCEHVFLPVDSTKEILACTKCGELIKARDTYGKNFFENK